MYLREREQYELCSAISVIDVRVFLLLYCTVRHSNVQFLLARTSYIHWESWITQNEIGDFVTNIYYFILSIYHICNIDDISMLSSMELAGSHWETGG